MQLKLNLETADPAYVQIERFLRRQIESGALKPAQRVPPTNELVQAWGAGRTAIQKALARLQADGLLERWPKRGTFVKEIATGVVGLLTGQDLTKEPAHFTRAMVRALSHAIQQRARLTAGANRRSHRESRRNGPAPTPVWTSRVYDQLTKLTSAAALNQHPAYQRLIEDSRHYPFKGWIEIATPYAMFQAADFGEAGRLPSVRFGSPSENTDAAFDMESFGRDCAAFFARQRCQRVVYLFAANDTTGPRDFLSNSILKGFRSVAAERGLPSPVMIRSPLHENVAATERAAFETTLRLTGEWRRPPGWPDGLMVSDDIIMRGVAMALNRRWATLGKRPALVTLANEGVDLHYGLPVVRWETPITETARVLMDRLAQRLAGHPPPPAPTLLKGKLKEEA